MILTISNADTSSSSVKANPFYFVFTGEVEEELELLQELVPESIYVKSASSGDLLVW